MKRIGLLFLLFLLCVNSVFADGEDFSLDEMLDKYMVGRLDLGAAQTICNKMFRYADVYNISINPIQYNDKICLNRIGCCKSNSDLKFVIRATIEVANTIVSAGSLELQTLPVCAQDQMQKMANSECGVVSVDSIVQCSTMDNRCVVANPIENGMFNVSCCVMPTIECTRIQEGNGDGYRHNQTNMSISGRTSVEWTGAFDYVPGVDNFDYDCNPGANNAMVETLSYNKYKTDISCKERKVVDRVSEYMEKGISELSIYSRDGSTYSVGGEATAQCAENGDRCVVNVPVQVSRGRKRKTAFYAWCIRVPFFVSDESCISFSGDFNTIDTNPFYSDKQKTLNDFDHKCFELVYKEWK